jgi:hypothetical protein
VLICVLESRVEDEHAGQFQARLLGHFCYLYIHLNTANELNPAHTSEQNAVVSARLQIGMDVHLNCISYPSSISDRINSTCRSYACTDTCRRVYTTGMDVPTTREGHSPSRPRPAFSAVVGRLVAGTSQLAARRLRRKRRGEIFHEER